MREAIAHVRTAEVTLAARATTHPRPRRSPRASRSASSTAISRVARRRSRAAARLRRAAWSMAAMAPLVTLYAGEGEDAAAAEALARVAAHRVRLRRRSGRRRTAALSVPDRSRVDGRPHRHRQHSDIPKEIADELGITVVPLTISFGDAVVPRRPRPRGRRLLRAPRIDEGRCRTTSQPPPALFEHAYEHLITQGDVVSVHLSHKFSGTVEAARQRRARNRAGQDQRRRLRTPCRWAWASA